MKKQTKSSSKRHHTSAVWAIVNILIKWSGIAVTDGRGKVGGTVFSKSRGGATAKNKVTPSNPRSANQSLIRARFTALSQQFRTLGAAAISAWNTAAASGFSLTNIFGDVVQMSGINFFVRVNQNLLLAGGATITSPPNPVDSAAPMYGAEPTCIPGTSLFLKADFGGASNTVPANNALVVYATPILSPGISNVRSKLRILTVLPAASNTATLDLLTAYETKYGIVAANDNIVFAMQVINTDSGLSGTPVQTALLY